MIDVHKWEIWEADVPFEDEPDSKKRPVLINEKDECFVISFKMTSHPPRHKTLDGEYEIMDWERAGLSKKTVIQCSKRLRLPDSAFTGKKYGRLTARDILGVQAMLVYMYGK